jgi:RNA polymerase sigma factor (sigma-70 family)
LRSVKLVENSIQINEKDSQALIPTAETERKLINKAQQGDKQAFGELVRFHHQGVINVVYRMCGDAQVAEDAAQDAFIRAWQNLPGYKPQSAFRNWLYRIAVNAALDMLRREPKYAEDIDEIPLASPGIRPEGAIIQAELSLQIQQAVLSLPKASRSVLILREYEGLTYRDIANTLDIPLGTVMSRLNYARNRLRDILAPRMEQMETNHV